MGGGGSKSSSTSVSGSAQKWAQPYAKAGASAVQNTFNQAQPGLQQLTQLTQGNIVPSLVNKFQSGLPVAQQATNFQGDVLSGKYLNGNPWLEQMIGQSRSDIANDVNSTVALSGRYGAPSAHQGVLAKQLADMEARYRYQNYDSEMNRMGQTAGQAQGANLADVSQALASIGLGAELPYTGSNNLANSLGALFNGGTQTSKSKEGGGLMGGLLGAAGSIGSALIMSDRRSKTNIKLLRRDSDGLGWYEFAYKRAPNETQIGVMADEVKELRPEAHIPNFKDGMDGVDYGKLGSTFKIAA